MASKAGSVADLIKILIQDALRREPTEGPEGEEMFNDVVLPPDMDRSKAEAFLTNRNMGRSPVSSKLSKPFNRTSDVFKFIKQLPATLEALERMQGDFPGTKGVVTPGATISLRTQPGDFGAAFPGAGAVAPGGRVIVGGGPLGAQTQRHEGIHTDQGFRLGEGEFSKQYTEEFLRAKGEGKDQYDVHGGNKFEIEADSGMPVDEFFNTYPRKAESGDALLELLRNKIPRILGRKK